jgi:hypothetical protein
VARDSRSVTDRLCFHRLVEEDGGAWRNWRTQHQFACWWVLGALRLLGYVALALAVWGDREAVEASALQRAVVRSVCNEDGHSTSQFLKEGKKRK